MIIAAEVLTGDRSRTSDIDPGLQFVLRETVTMTERGSGELYSRQATAVLIMAWRLANGMHSGLLKPEAPHEPR